MTTPATDAEKSPIGPKKGICNYGTRNSKSTCGHQNQRTLSVNQNSIKYFGCPDRALDAANPKPKTQNSKLKTYNPRRRC